MGTSGKTSTEVTAAHTAPLPGMVYLRRPAGAATVRAARAGRAGRADMPGADAATPSRGTRPTEADGVLSGTDGTTPARAAATAEITRLLRLWLEAFDGRRPVTALRRGPFSPAVLDDLRTLIRESLDATRTDTAPGSTPSRLLRVHLPPSHHRRLSFTASVAVSGRVRALVGHLGRHDSRWRVESVTLV
jgi:hypothetical protein